MGCRCRTVLDGVRCQARSDAALLLLLLLLLLLTRM
jgi:hypothetical protein